MDDEQLFQVFLAGYEAGAAEIYDWDRADVIEAFEVWKKNTA